MKMGFTLAKVIKIHKIIGVGIALWLIMMACTGILLNHSRDLNFDKKPIQSELILGFYGISLPKTGKSFILNNDISLHLLDKSLFWNQIKIQNLFPLEDTILAASNAKEVLIYKPGHLALYTIKGELIEMKKDAPISNATSIGTDQIGNFYLLTPKETYQCNSDFEIKIIGKDLPTINWVKIQSTDTTVINKLNQQNYYNEINYERILLDIHNGNIFGFLNKYLIDFFSIFFLTLILTGLYIWFTKLNLKK